MIMSTVFFVFTLSLCSSVLIGNESQSYVSNDKEELSACSCQGDKGKKTKEVSDDNFDDTKCGCGKHKKRSDINDLDEQLDRTCGICISLGEKPSQEPQSDENKETKKVDVERLLEGLASACVHAGAVAGAQDIKEQRQAACNLVGSIFFIASQIAKKDAKKIEFKEDNYEEAILLKSVQGLFVDKPCLAALSNIDDVDEREKAIDQYVSSPDSCKHFLQELFSMVKEFVKDYNFESNEKSDK